MAVEQTNFFCPVCQQGRLFQWRKGENQINPRFHCAECGHSDETKYLANPNLRSPKAQPITQQTASTGEPISPFSKFIDWFSGLNSSAKKLVVGSAVFVVLGGIGVIIQTVDQARNPENYRKSDSVETVPNLANLAPPPLAETESFKSLTSGQHLEEAKKVAKGSPNSAQIQAGLTHLEAIPSTAVEYKEAQMVTKQLQKLSDAEDAKRDIEQNPIKVLSATWRRGAFGAAGIWSVTFQNRSDRPVGDIKYRTRYFSETDNAVGGTGGFFGDGVIQKVIPPKQKRTIQLNDGFIDKEAASGTFEVTGWRFVEE